MANTGKTGFFEIVNSNIYTPFTSSSNYDMALRTDLSAQRLFIGNGSNCAAGIVLNSNYVGINNYAPVYQLDVSGNIHGTSNIYLGSNVSPTYSNYPTDLTYATGNIITSGNISAGNIGMFRNRIINGDMRVLQRGSTQMINNAGGTVQQFVVDRFANETNITSGYITNTQLSLASTDAPNQYGLQYYMRAQVQGACSSYGYCTAVVQRIEGYNIQDFNWGTTTGTPVTLSFWVRTGMTTGSIFNVSIRRGDVGYSYNLSVTINSANNWQYVTATIPAPPVTSAWSTINGLNGMGMLVSFGSLSSTIGLNGNTTTPNTWQAGNYFGSTSTTNSYATLNSYTDITGIQLEKGTIATPFEFRPYAIELQMCQRYYESSFPLGVTPGYSTGDQSADFIYCGQGISGWQWGGGRHNMVVPKLTTTYTITFYNPYGSSGAYSVFGNGGLIVTPLNNRKQLKHFTSEFTDTNAINHTIHTSWVVNAEL